MPNLESRQRATFVDAIWRVALRLAFPLARVWWRLRQPHHEGALVAVYVGPALLLLKTSYRTEWSFPGGSLQAGEAPDVGAQREMKEEIGLPPYPLRSLGSVSGVWDGRSDQVHFFELHLESLPELRLDNREIIGARLALPDELDGIALTAPVAEYVRRKRGGGF